MKKDDFERKILLGVDAVSVSRFWEIYGPELAALFSISHSSQHVSFIIAS